MTAEIIRLAACRRPPQATSEPRSGVRPRVATPKFPSIKRLIAGMDGDDRLAAAEAEIKRRLAWVKDQGDMIDPEKYSAVLAGVFRLRAYIAATAPETLPGAAVKLRHLLDENLGLPNGDSEGDLKSLAQVLELICKIGGLPEHGAPLAKGGAA